MTPPPVAAKAGRRPTAADVARAAGVSTATVSRALTGHPNVRPAIRDRVQSVARALGYTPNANASRLATGHTRTIGVLAPTLHIWYTSQVLAGVEDVLRQHGYDLLLGSGNPDVLSRVFDSSGFPQRVDALLLVDAYMPTTETARRLATLPAPPVMSIGARVEGIASMWIDNAHGGRLAADHLLGLGHQRLAIAGTVGDFGPIDGEHGISERVHGFGDAVRSAGLPWHPGLEVIADHSIDGGYAAARHLLDADEPPTAIFCLTDEIAYGSMLAAREHGVRVPEDLSLVGFDDHPAARAIGLTTVRQPVRDAGRQAAEILLDMIEKPVAAAHHELPLALVERVSTAAPPTTRDCRGRS